MNRTLTFIVPGDPAQRTGGYLYDAHMVEALRELGWTVEVIGLEGRYPHADNRAGRAMRAALADCPDAARVVVDGLALGAVPDAVLPHASRLDITGLVHHPLADETGLEEAVRRRLLESETRALAACRRIIVTSPFTARRVEALSLTHGPVRVIEPGVASAQPAESVVARLEGREPSTEQLLCVASVIPRKGQDILVEALAGLSDRDWRCRLVGSTERDAAFAARVSDAIETAGLTARIEFFGECNEAALDAAYRGAGLCLLPSHYEGYGMVVSEALARGLPMITTTGAALADTVPEDACIRVRPGDAGAFRAALARWFDDAALRLRLTRCAFERRSRLRSWGQAGRAFATAIEGQGFG